MSYSRLYFKHRKEIDLMPLNKKLKELRESRGMTQEELSRASGVGRVTISRIETGELENTTVGTISKLASGLSVNEGELFGD